MKKILALIIGLISVITLASCGEDDGVPTGMKIVNGGDSLGYYFYAPDEWTVANLGDIDAVYASAVDTVSVTFAEVDSSLFPLSEGESKEDYFFNKYFDASLEEFPDGLGTNVTENGKDCLFGTASDGADRAKKYVYEYSYSGHKFGFWQILLSKEDRFYIFTYSAQKAKLSESDASTRYDLYIENGKVQSIIDNFKLFAKKPTPAESPSTEIVKDSDGYILATDKALAGFELYLPESFKPDFSSAVVSATHTDGSNITLAEATRVGVAASEYWKTRQEELSEFVTDFTVIAENVETKLGNNSQWAFGYEYTYVYNGTKYHVYQILAVDGMMLFAKGYTFTYTAKEENYDKHFNVIEKIISKVVF